MAAKKSPAPKLTLEMVKIITDTVIEAYQTERREAERQQKASFDKRLHNTRLLLQNYRSFVSFSEGAIYEASQCEEDVYDVLSLMSGKSSDREFFVESIKTSAIRTRLIIEHVEKAVRDYGAYCERTKKEEDMRRYRTICRLYIDDDTWDVKEIATDENVDVSTVYKDVKEAVRRLTPRLFGIDSIR